MFQPTVWSKFPGHGAGREKPGRDKQSPWVEKMKLGAVGRQGSKSSQGSVDREKRDAYR